MKLPRLSFYWNPFMQTRPPNKSLTHKANDVAVLEATENSPHLSVSVFSLSRRPLLTSMIRKNRRATSWYQVCREFLLQIVFKD
jgi:hypothetical protein